MAICVFLYHIFHEVSEKKKKTNQVSFIPSMSNICKENSLNKHYHFSEIFAVITTHFHKKAKKLTMLFFWTELLTNKLF